MPLFRSMSLLRRIEEYLVYLLLFTLPFQARLIFFQADWYFSEWQSMSLYGTDLIILAILLLWFVQKPKIERLNHADLAVQAFLGLAILSIFWSDHKAISVYQSLKLTEFALLFLYIRYRAFSIVDTNYCFLVLALGGLFQALIAIAQFLLQRSLGLFFLGESLLSKTLPGVASFFTDSGEKIIRAYGTTPHPNVLAACLILSLAAWLALIWRRRNSWYYLGLAVTLFGLYTTFSRVQIGLFVLGIIFFCLLFRDRRFVFLVITLVVVTTAIFGAIYLPEIQSRLMLSTSDEAVQQRLFYADRAIGSEIVWLGSGWGSFVPELIDSDLYREASFYQPVHNIYLLIYAELGLIGIALFALFLTILSSNFIKSALRIKKMSMGLVLAIFLISGFFDHFLLTLQQGRLAFWLVLGYIASHHHSLPTHSKVGKGASDVVRS